MALPGFGISKPTIRTPYQRASYWFWWSVITVPCFVAFRWQSNQRHVTPADGALLILGNHTSFFDPFFASWHMFRRCNYMASAALFRVPIIAWPGNLCFCLGNA